LHGNPARNDKLSGDEMPQDKSGPVNVVTIKGTSVYIYHTPSVKDSKTYSSYTLVYTQAGKRKRKTAPTLEKAKSLAKMLAEQLSEGTGHLAALSPEEIADYTAATQILRRYGDVSLSSACQQFVDAMTRLDGHGTLLEAVDTHVETKQRGVRPEITVPLLVENFIAAKEREGLSPYYVKDIGRKLKRFAASFRCDVASIRGHDIKTWISKQGTGRSANNLRSAVSTLLSFAKESGYLPENERHAAEQVSKVNERPSAIGIYTPDELKRILNQCPSEMIPSMTIAAFAGLRSAEILRLDWADIDLDRGHIVLSAEKAKTATRRLIPITANLATWLKPHAKKNGRVTPQLQNLDNLTRKFQAICKKAGVEAQRNGFRHSFASYRLATEKSAAAVSLEMGNSPNKLFTNYREIVTEANAKDWFAISPLADNPTKSRASRRGAKAVE